MEETVVVSEMLSGRGPFALPHSLGKWGEVQDVI